SDPALLAVSGRGAGGRARPSRADRGAGAKGRRGCGRVRARVPAAGAGGGARRRLRARGLADAGEARMTEGGERELTMSEALNEALHEEMERDPGVFVVGEDIAQLGGLFQVTTGLLDRFGPQRVIDAPISEAAQAGAGVGAALVGCRPVVELQIADFVSLVIDQVVNHAGKWRYMSGGRVTVPLVVRGAVSSGIGMAAQHSQTLEAWFVHAPGVVVIMPSTPYDAKGLLKAAIRDDNPVVFLEKRPLYSRKGPVPEGDYTVPIGVADVKREGSDVTVATYAAGVHLALQAARQLAREGVVVEVVDLRTLKPLDVETLVGS